MLKSKRPMILQLKITSCLVIFWLQKKFMPREFPDEKK